jgi:hypothetical protein
VYAAPAVVNLASSNQVPPRHLPSPLYPARACLIFAPLPQVVSVYSTGNIGGVTAVDADTGASLWSSVTDGLVQGAPVAIANSVFIGSLAGDVVSYDVNYQGSSASGNPAWLNKANSIDKFVVGNSPLTLKPKSRVWAARFGAYAVLADGPVGTSLNKIEFSDSSAV